MTKASTRPYLPELDALSGNALANTLVQKLTPVADKVRNLKTRLGGRPYEAFLIHTRWSGGVRHKGTEEILSVTQILPGVQVSALTAQSQTLQSAGLDEVGTIIVSEISPSYTEDELLGIGPQGQPIPADQQFYWEITYPRPYPDAAVRRRYTVDSSPDYRATQFDWKVVLVKAGEERDRVTGLPQGD